MSNSIEVWKNQAPDVLKFKDPSPDCIVIEKVYRETYQVDTARIISESPSTIIEGIYYCESRRAVEK